jgi:hypothetical protein
MATTASHRRKWPKSTRFSLLVSHRILGLARRRLNNVASCATPLKRGSFDRDEFSSSSECRGRARRIAQRGDHHRRRWFGVQARSRRHRVLQRGLRRSHPSGEDHLDRACSEALELLVAHLDGLHLKDLDDRSSQDPWSPAGPVGEGLLPLQGREGSLDDRRSPLSGFQRLRRRGPHCHHHRPARRTRDVVDKHLRGHLQ